MATGGAITLNPGKGGCGKVEQVLLDHLRRNPGDVAAIRRYAECLPPWVAARERALADLIEAAGLDAARTLARGGAVAGLSETQAAAWQAYRAAAVGCYAVRVF